MKTNADKALDLIIEIENFNQEYKAISNEIGSKASDCWIEKDQLNGKLAAACLEEWLERKFYSEYSNCPITGREYEFKVPYWTATNKTEKDCPHCYAALKLIEKRKEIKQKRGRLKAQLTKIAKREMFKRGAA